MLFQPVNDLLVSRRGEGSGPNCTSAHALGIDSTGQGEHTFHPPIPLLPDAEMRRQVPEIIGGVSWRGGVGKHAVGWRPEAQECGVEGAPASDR